MPSHDIHVLAGDRGSETRTKKINNMLNELDKFCSKAREQEKEQFLVRSRTLAEKLNFSQSTICRNGFPDFFTSNYESIRYQENKGIVITTKDFVEERKKQREKLAEYKSDSK